MNILAVQTGRYDHFHAAVQETVVRYPQARLTGLIQLGDLDEAKAGHLFQEILQTHKENLSKTLSMLSTTFDYCLVPFEDRFGIQYWTFRSIPIRLRIHRIASYNKSRQFKEFILSTWVLESLFVTTIARVIFLGLGLLRTIWWRIRRSVSIVGTFALAGAALVMKVASAVGLHPGQWRVKNGLPAGRRKVVLHIPSLGLGGAQRQLAIFVERLDRSQWDVEVVTVDALDKFFEPAIRDLNVTIHYLNPHWQLYEVGIIWQLISYLYRNPSHVLHNWLFSAGALGGIAGTLIGTPTIIASVRSEHPSRFPWFFPLWERVLYAMTAPLQTIVIANSQAVRKENRRKIVLPDRKIVTIYNGIDFSTIQGVLPTEEERLRNEVALPRGAPVVGIVGRLSPEKDHATFLKAAHLIRQAIPHVKFLIVGAGPSEGQIRSMIADLELDHHVILTGERRDALVLMQLMDVLVLTSRSEGFPNVLLEAAAYGVAVVTTAAGGAVEVVVDGETGFVVPCADSPAVAEKIVKLMRDIPLRREFAEAARRRAYRMFSADQVARAIQGCYLWQCESGQVQRDGNGKVDGADKYLNDGSEGNP